MTKTNKILVGLILLVACCFTTFGILSINQQKAYALEDEQIDHSSYKECPFIYVKPYLQLTQMMGITEL